MSPPSRTSLPPPTPSHSSRLSQSSMLSSLCYSATSHQLSILQTHACMLSRFSRVSLFATLLTVACQASLSMGFSRQEYWSGLPCPSPRDLPNPGIELTSLTSSALAGRFFSTSATWKAHFTNDNVYNILQMVMYIFTNGNVYITNGNVYKNEDYPLSVASFAIIFSHSEGCLFILFSFLCCAKAFKFN